MIEVQIISHVLNAKDPSIFLRNSVNKGQFLVYDKEAEFLFAHIEKYGNVPDKLTFADRFPEFDFVAVSETEQFLFDKLNDHFTFQQLAGFVNELAERAGKDTKEAVKFMQANADRLASLGNRGMNGFDILKEAASRGNEYVKRRERRGLLGISTGIQELDELTNGWLPEDLITIVGRTNEGKSWVLLYFLVQAWKQGKRVLLYSGEMSNLVVGFRFDTLAANFSNSALMNGTGELSGETDYFEHLKEIEQSEAAFVVITPKDLNGNRLDVPTLHSLIEKYKPDIVGLDQLSLMDNHRATRGQIERIKYGQIAEDLYLTSEKYAIPILTPSQANRESAKQKKVGEAPPELHEISESDAIGQNSTRVISIKQFGNTLKLSLKKNRYGKNNQEILMLWNIDKGILKPFLTVDNSSSEPKAEYKGSELF